MGAYLDRSRTIEQAAAEAMIDEVRNLVGTWQRVEDLDDGASSAEISTQIEAFDAALDGIMPSLAEQIARYDKATIYDDGFNRHGSGPEPLSARDEDVSPGGSG